MGKWKDKTTYSRGDAERKPRVWEYLLTKRMAVTVVFNHLYHPNEWVMHCKPFFDTFKLEATSAEEAQEQAMMHVRLVLREALAAMPNNEQAA